MSKTFHFTYSKHFIVAMAKLNVRDYMGFIKICNTSSNHKIVAADFSETQQTDL